MKVEVVLTEADIAQEWAALSADPALYGGLTESWNALAGTAASLAKRFGGSVPVISFGAGDGKRDRLLMAALKDVGCECRYFPVDASQAMLELACSGADDDDLEAVGIKADISSPIHLVYAADASEPPRLFIMAGNTISSFDPLAEIRYVAQCLHADDWLIIDGELYDEKRTMLRRDNPVTRKFIAAALAEVGIRGDHGEIRFDHKRDDRHDGLHLITRYFHAAQDLTATVGGEEVSLERGERIGLNFQYTYTPDSFRWLLEDQGGLEIAEVYQSPDGRFVTALCKK